MHCPSRKQKINILNWENAQNKNSQKTSTTFFYFIYLMFLQNSGYELLNLFKTLTGIPNILNDLHFGVVFWKFS